MPRFYFEIVDGYTLKDPLGMELPTDGAARKVAREMAKQISIDVDDKDLTDVVVKTADGEEVYKTPIKPNWVAFREFAAAGITERLPSPASRLLVRTGRARPKRKAFRLSTAGR